MSQIVPVAPAIDVDDLSPTLRIICDLIGLPATLALVHARGGVRVYIPYADHLSAGHWLVQLLGRERAEALCRGLGSGELTIPRARRALQLARDRAIHAERASGASARQLASRYQLSERQLWEILSREPRPVSATGQARDERQMSLF